MGVRESQRDARRTRCAFCSLCGVFPVTTSPPLEHHLSDLACSQILLLLGDFSGFTRLCGLPLPSVLHQGRHRDASRMLKLTDAAKPGHLLRKVM